MDGFFMDWPAKRRPCHAGWPHDKAAQGKYKTRPITLKHIEMSDHADLSIVLSYEPWLFRVESQPRKTQPQEI